MAINNSRICSGITGRLLRGGQIWRADFTAGLSLLYASECWLRILEDFGFGDINEVPSAGTRVLEAGTRVLKR